MTDQPTPPATPPAVFEAARHLGYLQRNELMAPTLRGSLNVVLAHLLSTPSGVLDGAAFAGLTVRARKVPVLIEAMHWDGSIQTADLIEDWSGKRTKARANSALEIRLYIATEEGEMEASPGDWIVRGVAGEVYPCKPMIFASTYRILTEDEAKREAGLNDRVQSVLDFDPNTAPNQLEKVARRGTLHAWETGETRHQQMFELIRDLHEEVQRLRMGT